MSLISGNTHVTQSPLRLAVKALVAALAVAALVAAALMLSTSTPPQPDQPMAFAAQPGAAGDTLRRPGKGAQSETIQFPWKISLINTAKEPLTIASYAAEAYSSEQHSDGSSITLPPDFNGGVFDLAGKPLAFLFTLASGQKLEFRAYLGFTPNREVSDLLRSLNTGNNAGGLIDVHQAFAALTARNLFLYGGAHVSQTIAGGYTGPWQAPKYRLIFRVLGHPDANSVIGDFPRE